VTFPQVQRLDQRDKALPVEVECVGGILHRLVGPTEAEQVGRDHARAGFKEDGDHVPVEKAPGRLTVQAKEDPVGILGPIVDPRHAEPLIPPKTVLVDRGPGKIGYAGEAVLRGPHGFDAGHCVPPAASHKRTPRPTAASRSNWHPPEQATVSHPRRLSFQAKRLLQFQKFLKCLREQDLGP
jgi:hypothetical protein